jgi:hypothetical protein
MRTTSTPPAPIPQRALRGHRPARPSPRVAASADHHAQLAHRLTPRDRWLARMLAEHKVLTTHHITDLAFPTHRAANLRLLQLYAGAYSTVSNPTSPPAAHPCTTSSTSPVPPP